MDIAEKIAATKAELEQTVAELSAATATREQLRTATVQTAPDSPPQLVMELYEATEKSLARIRDITIQPTGPDGQPAGAPVPVVDTYLRASEARDAYSARAHTLRGRLDAYEEIFRESEHEASPAQGEPPPTPTDPEDGPLAGISPPHGADGADEVDAAPPQHDELARVPALLAR